jgi:hypothetical protein
MLTISSSGNKLKCKLQPATNNSFDLFSNPSSSIQISRPKVVTCQSLKGSSEHPPSLTKMQLMCLRKTYIAVSRTNLVVSKCQFDKRQDEITYFLVSNESSSFGSLNDLSIEDSLTSLVPSNLADRSAVNCIPVSTSSATIQLLDGIESPWVRIRRLHVLRPIIRSRMDHCLLLSTTPAGPGGLILNPSASRTIVNWSKAISYLISRVLYHPKVSMQSSEIDL